MDELEQGIYTELECACFSRAFTDEEQVKQLAHVAIQAAQHFRAQANLSESSGCLANWVKQGDSQAINSLQPCSRKDPEFVLLIKCNLRSILYGVLVMCQLDVTAKIRVEPVAQNLISNLLSYAASFKPLRRRRIGVISVQGSPMLRVMKGVGIAFDDLTQHLGTTKFDAYEVLVIDGGALELCKGRLDELRSFISRGGIVWIRQPQSVELLRQVAPHIVGLRKQKLNGRVVKVGDDELLSSISNSDLFWYREDCWYADWEGRGSGLIGDPADSVIELTDGDEAKALTQPCALAKVQIGNGILLIDTLNLTDPPSDVRDKATRIFSVLLTNLCTYPAVQGR